MICKSVASISCMAIAMTLASPAGARAPQAKTPSVAASAVPSTASPTPVAPDDVADQVMALMKRTRMFRVLSDHVPEFDGLLRSRIKTIVATMPQYAWEEQAHLQTQGLVQYYFATYMPMASDAAIYQLLKYDADNLAAYADKPEACIGYALGTPAFAKIAPADYIERVSNLKADMFESAFNAPQHRDFRPDLSDARTLFMAQYQKEGFDVADLALLGKLAAIPAVDACRAYTNFNKTIYDLGPRDGPFVMAAFTYAAPKIKPS